MQFNLIDEQWIPVRCRDGSVGKIAPHEVTKDFAENPVVSLDAPRPDFNGALIQFLIGLVQTAAAPRNASEWRRRLIEPPTPDELREKFQTVHHAFELGGDGPRFMQDFEELSVYQHGIDGLLIDMPGEKTTEKNTDHFVKRSTVTGMCPSCTATALYTMQTNAPSGGRGNMTSLRGGGPLTTLVLGDGLHNTLWHLIWLNILEDGKFMASCGNPSLTEDRFVFPWLGPTKMGKRKKGKTFYGEDTLPEHAHPKTMFWAMPRRIRLNSMTLESGLCGVCGNGADLLIESYTETPGGAGYTGWIHPLSPYYEQTTKGVTSILPVHAQPDGITYRHWLGLVITDGKEKKIPARIIHEFYDRWRSGWQFRLWAFGYDMKNMNARCWYESTMPLFYTESSYRAEYENIVANMVKAAVLVGENLRIALKNSIHGIPIVSSSEDSEEPHKKKIKWKYRDIKTLPADEEKRRKKVLSETKENTALVSAESYFWQNTESRFYELLTNILKLVQEDEDYLHCLRGWHNSLCSESKKLFDLYSWDVAIEDADPKRVVLARRDLEQFNRSKKIKELLGIPVEKAPKGTKAKAGRGQNKENFRRDHSIE